MRVFFLTVLIAASACLSYAQPRSLGGVFSFSGLDIIYQHQVRERDFIEIGAGLDTDGVLEGDTVFPGPRLFFGYRKVFLEKKYESGTLSIYTGPGFVTGMVRAENVFGVMAGISGVVAVEYRFRPPVIISLGICPIVGFHLNKRDSYLNLDAYLNGLKYIYYPRVGVKYSF